MNYELIDFCVRHITSDEEYELFLAEREELYAEIHDSKYEMAS